MPKKWKCTVRVDVYVEAKNREQAEKEAIEEIYEHTAKIRNPVVMWCHLYP